MSEDSTKKIEDVHEVANREISQMTLQRLHGLHLRGKLQTDDYQRNYVDRRTKWNTKLLESILCGIDIGSVEIVKEEVDDDEIYYIVDGQHRLMTIMRYLDNEFTMNKGHLTKVNPDRVGRRFKKLPGKWQNRILDTQITAFIYEENEHHDAASIFLRRNEGANNLSRMERLNATWCRSDDYKALHDLADTKEWQEFAVANNTRFVALRVLMELIKDVYRYESGEDITKTNSEQTHYTDNIHNKLSEKDRKALVKRVNDFLELWRVVAGTEQLNVSKAWDCTDDQGNKPHRIMQPVLTIVLDYLAQLNKTESIANANDIRAVITQTVTENAELFFPVGDTRKFTVSDETIRALSLFLIEECEMQLEDNGVTLSIAPPVSKALRKEILNDRVNDDGTWTCAISGATLTKEGDIDIDHMVKRSLGGLTVPENLRIVHKTLNRSQRYNLSPSEEEE